MKTISAKAQQGVSLILLKIQGIVVAVMHLEGFVKYLVSSFLDILIHDGIAVAISKEFSKPQFPCDDNS